MERMDGTFEPFANGTEFMDWSDDNCASCSKEGDCVLWEALAHAFLGSGTIPREIAERIGTRGERLTDCKEFESLFLLATDAEIKAAILGPAPEEPVTPEPWEIEAAREWLKPVDSMGRSDIADRLAAHFASARAKAARKGK